VVGGIATAAEAIAADRRTRPPRQHEARREGLALLTATVPDVRSADLTDLAASPPRAAERPDTRHRRIGRLSGDGPVEADAVMAPHARGLLARPAADGRTVVPMLDRTRAAGRRRVVAVAARAGGRALPPARRVEATGGAIGLPERREAVEAAARLLPDGTRPVLTGGRFYGSPESIGRCRRQGRGWRPRLKQDPPVFEAGGGTGPKACSARGERLASGVELAGRRVATDVATVHEPGTPSPGSSPCRSRRPSVAPSTTASGGASRRCPPTSRPAASGRRTAASDAPSARTA
jgi:hypothetical protein